MENKGRLITCKKCSHRWRYRGSIEKNAPFRYINCPKCYRKSKA